MERAARSLAKLKLSGKISTDELAIAAWPDAVGPRIASHARAAKMVRGNLIVEVEDPIWQKQLFHLRFDILRKIREILGDGSVTDVEFRLATPKRPPQMSQSLTSLSSTDEADSIADRSLRIVYRKARRKAAG